MVKKIKKRNNEIVDFNQDKITNAIFKAAKVVAMREGKEADYTLSQRVSDKVVGQIDILFGNGMIPAVEQIQDLVERQLIKDGYADTAKTFIIYRQHHKEKRERSELENSLIGEVVRNVKDYIRGDDWETRENANTGSIVFQGLNALLAGKALRRYALNEMYEKEDPEIRKLHENASIHIHDLNFPIIAYCCGHSIEQLIRRGFGEVSERVQSSAAKHLETIVAQMVNYIGTMQGEFAGAQAFSSVDTFLAPFVREDNLSQDKVSQYMQMLIYGLNVPSRWGWQAPFSNLTFDLTIPDDLKDKKVIIGGEERRSVYGDYQKEMDMINLGFLKTMEHGDKSGRIFTFPIPTYNLTKNFNWDSEVANKLFEVTGKYGIPYFQNYIGSNLDPKSIRAMCCRLNLDQTELINRPGGMWGPGDSTGSIGVVTINANRIGYEARNEEEFFNILGYRMDMASEALEVKRETIEDLLERGLVPYTKSYLGHFSNHFSTIGINGMNEACVNFLKKDISTPEGKDFAIKTLKFMREKAEHYQKETGNLYNIEATPAESTSYRFAKNDKKLYPRIHVSGNGEPFLTNSTQLPVDSGLDLYSALKHQEDIQTLYNGGTIFHAFLGERIDGKSAKTLVRKIAETTKLPYFSITPVFSICSSHGYLNGKQESCPTCGEGTEIYDRIVGYLRPVRSWNKGKQEEFKYRKRWDGDKNGL